MLEPAPRASFAKPPAASVPPTSETIALTRSACGVRFWSMRPFPLNSVSGKPDSL